jgi:hypothetical protein
MYYNLLFLKLTKNKSIDLTSMNSIQDYTKLTSQMHDVKFGPFLKEFFEQVVDNFDLTNPIDKVVSSIYMECSQFQKNILY